MTAENSYEENVADIRSEITRKVWFDVYYHVKLDQK